MGEDDNLVEYCDRLLFSMLGSYELVDKWWKSPNKAFNMTCPSNVWMEENGKEAIKNYLETYVNK